MPQNTNLSVVRNDNFVADFQFLDADDNAIDLTGVSSVDFRVAADFNLAGPADLHFSLGSGIVVPNPIDGTIKVSTPPIDLDVGDYKYDFSYTLNSIQITWLRGFFVVNPEVTP